MMWFEIICLIFILMIKNEAIAWILLLAMVMPPILKIGFAWARVMKKESRRCAPSIDDEGFYI